MEGGKMKTKKINKHLLGASLCTLFLVVSSCSSDNVTGATADNRLSINASSAIATVGDPESRVTLGGANNLTPLWESTDAIALKVGTETATLSYKGGAGTQNGKFTGTISAASGTMYAYYPASAATSTDLTSQTGTEAAAAKNTVMFATDSYKAEPVFNFTNKVAILKLNMNVPNGLSTTGTLTVTVKGAYSKGTLGTDGEWTNLSSDDISVSDVTISNGKINGYVVVLPGSDVNVLTIKVSDGTKNFVTDAYISTTATILVNKIVTINQALVEISNFKSVYTAADYYQWDAVDASKGKDNAHYYVALATQSCKNCATVQEVLNYLAAGVYWDDGSSVHSPSFTLPDGKTYKVGLWLKKGANTGNATATSVKPQPATDEIRTNGQYFFLPLTGAYWGHGSSYSDPFTYAAGYWLKNAYKDDEAAPSLNISSTDASIGYYYSYQAFVRMFPE